MHELAQMRVKRCVLQFAELEHGLLEQSQRFGPIWKDAVAAMATKLMVTRQRVDEIEEVGSLRAALLQKELSPLIESVEDGLKDLDRVVRNLRERPAIRPEELEATCDELSRLESWFLVRMRYSAGEPVIEGYYRCCACGGFNRPGPGMVMGWCARCGGDCHHRVS
jgi:hypothetical protein